MKRKIWLMLSMVLLFSLMLTGCEKKFEPTPLAPPELTAKQELQIKEAYILYMQKVYEVNSTEIREDGDKYAEWVPPDMEDVTIVKYAGTYNGNVAVLLSASEYHFCVIGGVNIGGYTIKYPYSSYDLLIYSDSQINHINDAYDQRQISRADIRNIKWYIEER